MHMKIVAIVKLCICRTSLFVAAVEMDQWI